MTPYQKRKLAKLIEAYRDAAEGHYWMQDQGTGKAVSEAEERFKESQEVLYKYIAKLE